ncbi:hypothetical protein AC622_11405 [Bacillus sp. FJAT-27916]|uniref:hypothetical protein n=1 Tax=Bacillaceae TaxID=186817 RepID=UPI0006709282|nr:hypothetical protein [Bacillus sp. FJAT-27916]KMY44755.1 hypothetical protein AC622_11405 [Bacillus sp. FJAT-27916]
MKYVKYSLMLLGCYFTLIFIGTIPVMFYKNWAMFMASYSIMVLSITILMLGLFFLNIKESHQLKLRMFVIHTFAYLLFHFNFYDYAHYSSLVFIYPIATIATLVAYNKHFQKHNGNVKKIYY